MEIALYGFFRRPRVSFESFQKDGRVHGIGILVDRSALGFELGHLLMRHFWLKFLKGLKVTCKTDLRAESYSVYSAHIGRVLSYSYLFLGQRGSLKKKEILEV